MPDGSGRQVTLFKQWNEGVLDLLQEYGEYIPDTLKKFIINVLNDNTIFGNGGAQAKMLQDYFNIKADKEDLGIGEGGVASSEKKKTTQTDIYVETKDTKGVFKVPSNNSLQLKKENFEKVPFIIEGNQKGQEPTSYVCYYLGTVNNLVLFKFKTNNIDFLNNYKRQEQVIEEPDNMKGNVGTEVMYGAFPIPRGSNKDLSVGDDMPIYFIENTLEGNPKGPGIFGIDKVMYLQGESDGGVMRLDVKNPPKQYGDVQHELKIVQKKFSNIKT